MYQHLSLLVFIGLYSSDLCLELKTSSQCFHMMGHPTVSMKCDGDELVLLQEAIHGIHPNRDTGVQGTPQTPPWYLRPPYARTNTPTVGQQEALHHCEYTTGDCTENQIDSFIYDWPDCIGRTSCVHSVKQSWLASCNNYSSYLQVKYSCVPGRYVHNICRDVSMVMREGNIRSPDYPDHYPPGLDCQCELTPPEDTSLLLTFYDVALESPDVDKCADWLLVKHGTGPDLVTDLNCGHIKHGKKRITAKKGKVLLHFHSDDNDSRAQVFTYNTSRKLKGFWLHFEGVKKGKIKMKCGPVKPAVTEPKTDKHHSLPLRPNKVPHQTRRRSIGYSIHHTTPHLILSIFFVYTLYL